MHQLQVGFCALDKHVVELPGKLNVWYSLFDRWPLLAEFLHCDFDHLRLVRHCIIARLLVHIHDQFESLGVFLDHFFAGRENHVKRADRGGIRVFDQLPNASGKADAGSRFRADISIHVAALQSRRHIAE
jgi:hypothetical protein